MFNKVNFRYEAGAS